VLIRLMINPTFRLALEHFLTARLPRQIVSNPFTTPAKSRRFCWVLPRRFHL